MMTIPARITVTAPIAAIETLNQGGGCLATPTPISKAPTSKSAIARIVINVDGGLKIQQRYYASSCIQGSQGRRQDDGGYTNSYSEEPSDDQACRYHYDQCGDGKLRIS